MIRNKTSLRKDRHVASIFTRSYRKKYLVWCEQAIFFIKRSDSQRLIDYAQKKGKECEIQYIPDSSWGYCEFFIHIEPGFRPTRGGFEFDPRKALNVA